MTREKRLLSSWLKRINVRHLVMSMALLVACRIPSVTQSNCKPSDPSGYFEGTATTQQAGRVDISLNLRCDNGRYAGEVATPVGSYSVKEGHLAAGKLFLTLEGADRVTVEVTSDGSLLRGKFASSDDSGPLELRRVGDPKKPAPVEALQVSPVEALQLSKTQWHADLRFLAEELPKRHANAFHTISHEQFMAEVADLDRKLDHMNDDEIYVGMDRIVNLIGDGHTFIQLPADDANLPMDVERFGNHYRVVTAAAEYAKALGGRLLKIDDTPIVRAHDLIYSLTPADETTTLRESRVNGFLTVGLILHGTGITRDRNTARYTLANDDGRELTVDVHSVAPGDSSKIQWVYAFKERPLFRQRPDDEFWYTYLPDSHTIYCSFRGYKDLGKNSKGLFELINKEHPDKLVVDLRLNGGGDYTKGLKYLVHPIRDLPDINRKGHLFVLIGPKTFSAAMSNSAHFRYQTNAILVGEPIGEKPNSYQEAREMTLPNSHWVVRYSVKFYKFVETGENIIRPDKEIVPSWSDYQSGRDPVLAWVLNYGSAKQ